MDTKYKIVKDGILADIKAGKYKVGDKLPTESELMAIYSVSRYTIRRAATELENDHYVHRIQGGGMFVDNWQKQQTSTLSDKKIGVVTTHLANYIFPSIIFGIDRVLSANGYSLLLANTHNNHELERQSVQNMLNVGVQGIIVEPTLSAIDSPNSDLYEQIKEDGIPVVVINAAMSDKNFPVVAMDDTKAEFELVNYLISQGHSKILGVFKVDDAQGVHRMRGFTNAFQQQPNLAVDANIVMYQSGEGQIKKALDKVETYLEGPNHPTAIAFYNDDLAIQAIDLIRSLGYQVPGDISIVGFDDFQLSEYINPSLTTTQHPKNKMGFDAAEMLFKLINGEKNVDDIIYEPQMVIRNSVKKIN